MELGLCKWLSNEMKLVNQNRARLSSDARVSRGKMPGQRSESQSHHSCAVPAGIRLEAKAAVRRTFRPRRGLSPGAGMKAEGEMSLPGLDSPEGCQAVPSSASTVQEDRVLGRDPASDRALQSL